MNTVTDVVRAALAPTELAALTRRYAAAVRAGRHPVRADPDQRWHVRLRADAEVDVWLISWTTEQGTELHDHGGSSGAFTVVSGELTESRWSSAGLVDAIRSAGSTVTFGDRYVHDVRNHAEPTAVSVHAYSPPLSLMRYYDVGAGRLVERDAVWTDDPERRPPAGPDGTAAVA